jgi:hypothetical protein
LRAGYERQPVQLQQQCTKAWEARHRPGQQHPALEAYVFDYDWTPKNSPVADNGSHLPEQWRKPVPLELAKPLMINKQSTSTNFRV